MKILFTIVFILTFTACSDEESYEVIFPEKVFIEFNWCSYEPSKEADDLGKVFIDYRNFLDSDNFYATYLNPIFQVKNYDFILMESFKNKEVFQSNLQDKESFFYKRWKSNFDNTAKCNELNKQYFYERSNSNLEELNKKGAELQFLFCKKLDNVSINQILDNLQLLQIDNTKNVFILTPEVFNDYYDYLFVISNNNGDSFEGEILLNNIGFLVNCDLNFNDENFNQLIFESYPLI